MSRCAKKWLIAGIVLLSVGAMMLIAVMTSNHWKLSRLSTEVFETNSYEIGEKFGDILLNMETADILFLASGDDTCRVVCYEQENMKHSAEVRNGTLTVSAADAGEWYEHIGLRFDSPKVTVYLPKEKYASLVIMGSTGSVEVPDKLRFDRVEISLTTGNVILSAAVSESVTINATTGDIRVENIPVGAMDIRVSTGEVTVSDVGCGGTVNIGLTTGQVEMRNVTCRELVSNGSTGKISLKSVIAEERLSIERSTGDVVLEGSDAADIFIRTATGNVRGTLLTEKMIITETATGSVNVPGTVSGGRCEIITSTGDIKIGMAD